MIHTQNTLGIQNGTVIPLDQVSIIGRKVITPGIEIITVTHQPPISHIHLLDDEIHVQDPGPPTPHHLTHLVPDPGLGLGLGPHPDPDQAEVEVQVQVTSAKKRVATSGRERGNKTKNFRNGAKTQKRKNNSILLRKLYYHLLSLPPKKGGNDVESRCF